MRIVLGIDGGRLCGWAAYDCTEKKLLSSGVFDLTSDTHGQLFCKFWMCLERLRALKPRFIAYEKPHHRGEAATNIGVGITTRIEEFCELVKTSYCGVHSGTLKKWATGKGAAKKPEMIESARKYKPDVADDNEADAILIAVWGAENTGGWE